MRHIVESLVCELARHIEVVLYRPNTAGALERGAGNPRLTLVQFEASKSRMLRGLAHYNPILQYREVMRLRSLRPDLIHVFNGDGYLLPALALRMIPAVPMMVTLHDPIPHPGDLIGRLGEAIRRRRVGTGEREIQERHRQCSFDQRAALRPRAREILRDFRAYG